MGNQFKDPSQIDPDAHDGCGEMQRTYRREGLQITYSIQSSTEGSMAISDILTAQEVILSYLSQFRLTLS